MLFTYNCPTEDNSGVGHQFLRQALDILAGGPDGIEQDSFSTLPTSTIRFDNILSTAMI